VRSNKWSHFEPTISTPPGSHEVKNPKALIIRLSSLGDLVLSTAAIAPLREAGYSVSFATKSEFASLFLGQPGIEQVYSFDKKAGGEKAARQAFIAWAKLQGFNLVIDLQNSWRTWRWRGELRCIAPVFVLPKPRLLEWLILFLRLGPWLGFGKGGRALRFRDAAIQAIGSTIGTVLEKKWPLTQLQAGNEEISKVAGLLPEGDFIALLPASAWKSKEWPHFAELAALLAQRVPVVVLGGSRDAVCSQVAASAQAVNPASRSLHGQTSLRESMAVLAKARWVIGNDTGMVHVAEALGKPVAMVEGPTHPYMGFSPHRDDSLLLGLPLLCRPCSKSGRFCMRFGSRLCLKGLTASAAADRLRERGFPC
jgi:ADP-heptose:LPS heptosyltransferase